MPRQKRGPRSKRPAGRTTQTPFVAANKAFERWLGRQCKVDKAALKIKHRRMHKDAFKFLRATYFRWAEEIEQILPDLAPAPAILAVGDAHVENFGIWHDREHRLVWGVNDFDDAAVMPYPFDLVRLAVSAMISGKTPITRSQICSEIMRGYRSGLAHPGPYVLDESHSWLRRRVRATKKSIERFWRDIDKQNARNPPSKVKLELRKLLPDDCQDIHYKKRIAGGGSLGRPRFIAVASWRGGRIVREAKALVPSGWDWAHHGGAAIRYLDLANGKSRSPDPNLSIRDGYLFRHLSPESRKLELGEADDIQVDRLLLQAMGHEIGAIHGTDRADAKRITEHLKTMKTNWLVASAIAAQAFIRADFGMWQRATTTRARRKLRRKTSAS